MLFHSPRNQYINTIFDELARKYKSSINRVILLGIKDKNVNYDNPIYNEIILKIFTLSFACGEC